MDFDTDKFLFCLVVSVVGLAVHIRLRGRSDEAQLLGRGVVLLILLRLISLLGLHILAAGRVLHTDALTFYIPQVESVLRGLLPYRDFQSSYGPLFPYLLVPGQWLWRGVGGVALTMAVAEILMVRVWLAHADRRGDRLPALRAAWLYVANPLTWYWTVLMGHNGVLVALGIMIALVSADRGHAFRAVVAGVAALWCAKFLALLAWPAVAWGRAPQQYRRTIGLAAGGLLLFALMPLGMDPMQPFTLEAGRYTGGNIWTILAMIVPALYRSAVLDIMSLLCLGAAALYLTRAHLRRRDADRGFADSCALYGAMGLVFMVLSKKTFVMYEAMHLPFVLHALATRGRLESGALAALALLGVSATTQLPVLWLDDIVAAGPTAGWAWWGLLAFQAAKVAAHGVLAWSILRGRSHAASASS